MFKKKECYLCGGKLVKGKCTFCGLDNQKAASKNYRLNESIHDQKKITYGKYSGEKTQTDKNKTKIGKTYSAGQRKTGMNSGSTPRYQGNRYRPQNQSRQRYSARGYRRESYGRKKRSVVLAVLILMGILAIGIETISSYVNKKRLEDLHPSWNLETYDPYAGVTRELSETGEVFDITLMPGEYKVGVWLPEGNYTASLQEGSGSLSLMDMENVIFLNKVFGTEEEYGEVTEVEDLKLYEGGIVTVNNGLVVNLHTENGQMQEMETMDNPLTETIYLEPERTYTAGDDFPEGVYDVTGEDWGDLEYSVYLGDIYEDEDLNYESNSIWFSEGEEGTIYCNVVLPKGAEVTVGTDVMVLTPSKKIESEDYDGYYDVYR